MNRITSRIGHLAIALTSLFLLGTSPSFADDATPPAKDAAPASTYVIDGFRSSKFGMTEQQVRDAIRNDFPSAKSSLDTNTVEKTSILTAVVPNLLPDTGEARVSYIFGYNSKKLIQISVLWAGDTKSQSPETLISTGNLLRDYFLSLNLPQENVVVNGEANDGTIIFFRGNDSKDHMVLLTLVGGPPPGKDDSASAKNAHRSLHLAYILDGQHPDVYHLPSGSF